MTTTQPTLAQRVSILAGRLELISWGTTSNLDSVHGGDDAHEPPGTWRNEPVPADEFKGEVNRTCDLWEVELGRLRGERTWTYGRHAEDRDRAVLSSTRPARYLAYVLDMHEDQVRKLRARHGKDPESGERGNGRVAA